MTEDAIRDLVSRLDELDILGFETDDYDIEFQRLEDVAVQMAEQIDYELRAAWRLGYDWVHVYEEIGGREYQAPQQFGMRMHLDHSMDEQPEPPNDTVYRYSYDLRDVTRAQIEEALYD